MSSLTFKSCIVFSLWADQETTQENVHLLCIFHSPTSVSAFTKKPKTQEAEEGSSVVFEAETEKADAKVRWQCNSKDIASGNNYLILAEGNKHSLTIQTVTKEDASVYAVIAGGSKVKFELKVISKPGGGHFDAESALLRSLLFHFHLFVVFTKHKGEHATPNPAEYHCATGLNTHSYYNCVFLSHCFSFLWITFIKKVKLKFVFLSTSLSK